MTLHEYMQKKGLSGRDLARLLSTATFTVGQQHISRLCRFQQEPGTLLALHIQRFTGGKVKPHELLSPEVRAEHFGEKGRP